MGVIKFVGLLLATVVAVQAADNGKMQTYNLTSESHEQVLALLKSHIQFHISYPLKDGKMQKAVISPATSKFDFHMGGQVNEADTKVRMVIIWAVGDDNDTDDGSLLTGDGSLKDMNLTVEFEKSEDKETVYLNKAMLKFPIVNNKFLHFNKNAKHFNNYQTLLFTQKDPVKIQYSKSPETSFKCEKIVMDGAGTETSEGYKGQLEMAHNQIQTFLPKGKYDFAKDVVKCPQDVTVEVGEGNWELKDDEKKMCLQVKGTFDMLLKYTKNDTNQTLIGPATVPVPKDAAIDLEKSSCGNATRSEDAVLFLRFFEKQWSLEMKFTNLTGKQFQLKTIKVEGKVETGAVAARYFKDFKDGQTIDAESASNASYDAMSAANGKYLLCATQQTLTIDERSQLTTKGLTIQAFMPAAGTQLQASNCANDQKTADLVPIIVGACLALLVVIVLVAYLIGRHRAKRTGYSSV